MIYQYDHPVRLGEQILRVHPLLDDAVPTVEYSLAIEPEDHSLRWQQDDFGNTIARVTVPGRTTKLSIRARVVADVQTMDRALPKTSEPLGRLPFSYPNALRAKLSPYLPPNPSSRELARYIQAASRPGPSMLEFALELNRKFAKDVRHTERLEPGVQSPSETLELGSGSCRDSAWLLVQTLRQAGIAARFVSGYLVELAEPGSDSTDDALSFHAWCEFYLPSTGWIALDPSIGRPTSFMYIPLAAAPSPELVAPLEGMVEVAETELSFPMRVRRITANAAPP
jgi:transglutaminase-like putative cysteine protease